MVPKATIKWKNPISQIFHPKKSESFDVNWWNGICFSKISGTQKSTISTWAPPSSYNLNLKILAKVSKVSWTCQLLHAILWYWIERKVRKFKKASFLPKKSFQKPGSFRVKKIPFILWIYLWKVRKLYGFVAHESTK